MRFTIRDLLWLMVVVACLLGWWVEHRQMKAMAKEGKTWEARAYSLRNFLMETNKYAEVEFVPDGVMYIPKRVYQP